MDQQQPSQLPEGLRKAAVLLASLPSADSAYLLRELDEEQLHAVARAAAGRRPEAAEQLEILRELRRLQAVSPHQGNHRSPSQRPSQAQNKVRRLFACLSNTSPHLLVRLLEPEIPQTIALVLAHLEPEHAAEVLERLPTEKQIAVAVRIADLSAADATALTDVAQVLAERSKRLGAALMTPVGGVDHLARIIQATNSATEKALLANVSQESQSLVDRVNRQLKILRELKRLKAA
jgi:flagellar motor switch protein FliG